MLRGRTAAANEMITLDEALTLIRQHSRPLPPARTALDDCLGLVLAEDVTSDVDSPPHDKAMVDGYAVIAADGQPRTVIEEVTAGKVPSRKVTPGTATRIMTGAPVPEGADAVVMVERTETLADGTVRLLEPTVTPTQNIMHRATSMRRGDVVLGRGTEVRPIEAGLLAEVGCARPTVVRRPTVAVVATGDELVPLDQTPGAGQLRNSNGPLVVAAVRCAGAVPIDLGIATDDPDDLEEKIIAGLASDVLLLSGGVSAGVLDLVPGVLERLGVEKVFHKVQIKPGKPVWFGVKKKAADGDGPPTLVFGLPGNPVSGWVCFELLVRPAIGALSGRGAIGLTAVTARLAGEHHHRGGRLTFRPAVLWQDEEGSVVETVDWQGSADLAGLVSANSLVQFPPVDRKYKAGEEVRVLPLR